jgi:hypothetical protein
MRKKPPPKSIDQLRLTGESFYACNAGRKLGQGDGLSAGSGALKVLHEKHSAVRTLNHADAMRALLIDIERTAHALELQAKQARLDSGLHIRSIMAIQASKKQRFQRLRKWWARLWGRSSGTV